MKEDESLGQRLNEWIDGKNNFDRLCSVDLAARVRKLRSVRTRRRRVIVASVVLLFAGIGVYFSTFRMAAEPVPDSIKQVASHESLPSTQSEASELEVTLRLDELKTEIERSNSQIGLLVLTVQIQQMIAETDSQIRESSRKSLREEQASQWLATTFREMAVREHP